MFKLKMGREIIGSLFWLAVGTFFALIAATMILGTFRKPGPGFLPLGVALLLILCSLIDLVKDMRKPITPLTGIQWRRPAIVLLSVFLFGFLLHYVGFSASTFILMVVLFGLLLSPKKLKWVWVIIYAAASASFAWLVFEILLRIPFPVPLIGVKV
jgi:hypothetical protein